MHITKIDELIEKTIDNLYFLTIDNKEFYKIAKEVDYVKYQKEINNIMISISQSFNFAQIKEYVKNNDAVNQIIETLKKYIAYYIFLMIGFFYVEKEDKYINNLVEFGKNQPSYKYKIENFFNSESNALLLKYYKMIRNIVTLLNADQQQIEKVKTKPDFRETIIFLNTLGGTFIEKKFKLKNLNNNINMQAHNIIKTIIVMSLYGTNDKKDFFRILESTEIVNGEFMFIDIVVPTKKTIDFSLIESILIDAKNKKMLAFYLWQYFTNIEEKISAPIMTHDEKLLEMFNSKIVIPITDDFLLYNKESEKYDRTTDASKIKKKEDTKIKYIINKLDKIKELYSDTTKNDIKVYNEIKKFFYAPMLNRKAVLVNIKEDINIINKFINMGKQNTENIDFFKDLENYRLYPYVNFNDYDTYGFPLVLNKTLNIARKVSFDKTGDFKQIPPYNIIQTRVGSKDMTVNIVGIMIPSTNSSIQCIKTKNTIDIRSIDKKNTNGLDLIAKYLEETNMNLREHSNSVYWLFDENLDKFKSKSYEQIAKFTAQDRMKYIVSDLYDEMHNSLYKIISNIFTKNNNLTLQDGYKTISNINDNFFTFKKNEKMYSDIENILFESIQIIEPTYDKISDSTYDIIDDIIDDVDDINIKGKKPVIFDKNKNLVKINLSTINEYGEIHDKEIVEGICQHNISKDKIDSIDKKDFTRYSNELYQFIQQYVTKNIYNEYICKSCGYSLDIREYIEDGEYDNETRSFVTFSTPFSINLEEVIGYEKYRVSIRQIDKLVERIAIAGNILHLSKGSFDVKSKRKLIVKNTIDLVIANNKKLKQSYKDRENKIAQLYGINSGYSNFFIFDLDNNIFVFSSRDIDKFKATKINNIIAYSLFFIILEITYTHIFFIGDDKKKLCNFANFEKFMEPLFSGLKIIVNNRGDIEPILNYKILCYIIYVLSCSIVTQTRMWHYNYKSESERKKNIPFVQKTIIHTLIDIINTILENGKDDRNNQLYGLNTLKFFKKLQEIFSDSELYTRLKKESQSISNFAENNKTDNINFIELSGKYSPVILDLPKRRTCFCPTVKIPKLVLEHSTFDDTSNLTNCSDGKYHIWVTDKKDLVCKLCKLSANGLKLNDAESKSIREKFHIILKKEIVETVCDVDGKKHIFIISNTGEEICNKCKRKRTHEFSNKEINDAILAITNNNTNENNKIMNDINTINVQSLDKKKTASTTIDSLIKEYEKKENYNMIFISLLTDEIQKVIGNELSDINLTENLYLIDHDHLGNSMNTVIKITESQNKIIEKANHPYFKTDVLYYTNFKYGKIDVFYDAHTKILLGYKEENKNYTLNKKHDKKIHLIYSFTNKIKLLGYKSKFIDISDIYNEIVDGRPKNKINMNAVTKQIIEYAINERIIQIKKVIYYFNMVLSKILNNVINDYTSDDYYRIKLGSLIDKYRKKITNLNLSKKGDNDIVFKEWNVIYNSLLINNIDDIKLNFDFEINKSINYADINKIDNIGNTLTFYFVRELLKIFEFNKDKIITTSISNFIVDFINVIFEIIYDEKFEEHIETKRFKYILNSTTYIAEVEEKSDIRILEGINSEYVDSDDRTKDQLEEQENENEDMREEIEALDIDVDMEDIDESGEEAEASYDLARYLDD
ncbi:hypothetical protein BMW23_0402 [Bodo saltans virus]|uniref:Uncharacterized protein n=1 Tax=Bodo saltans virus TaxID=2024608 RepID=A0A2H4UUB2_9VIRU|nr:hypothetical protein QJ851_gp0393 [Bodo saltans virus]ATZ80456.1 hypothetical protein BMW23_0402 [Bodo saltans virus]